LLRNGHPAMRVLINEPGRHRYQPRTAETAPAHSISGMTVRLGDTDARAEIPSLSGQ
jgi:hypothetical protein